jgi:predicted RNase H-like nuclease (RuvC/YqgF family)
LENSWCNSEINFEKKEEEKINSHDSTGNNNSQEVAELKSKIEELTMNSKRLAEEVESLSMQNVKKDSIIESQQSEIERLKEELKCATEKIEQVAEAKIEEVQTNDEN